MEDQKQSLTPEDLVQSLDFGDYFTQQFSRELVKLLSAYPSLTKGDKQSIVYLALRKPDQPVIPYIYIPCMEWINAFLNTNDMDVVRRLLEAPELKDAYHVFRTKCIGQEYGSILPPMLSLWNTFQRVPDDEQQQYLYAFMILYPAAFRARAFEFALKVARFFLSEQANAEYPIAGTFRELPRMLFVVLVYTMLILFQQRDEERSSLVNEGVDAVKVMEQAAGRLSLDEKSGNPPWA
ncbi:hypothetical protein GGS26DRAFT_424423 [Hypomontagnella submonticulosa]|nr:hypothetical protein GGS26DRAFT_424423 [Hypomontagnella submonticulosa]